MGRMYIAPIDLTAAASNRDIFELTAGTSKPVHIHEVLITTDIETDAAEVQIQLLVQRLASGFTSGSGGSAITVARLGSSAETATGASAEQGNTTKASGTATVLSEPYMNNRVGIHLIYTPESRPGIASGEGFVVSLQAVPASTAFGGHVIFEELI